MRERGREKGRTLVKVVKEKQMSDQEHGVKFAYGKEMQMPFQRKKGWK